MKNILGVLLMLLISCNQQKNIMTSFGVLNYKIGNKITEQVDNDEFEIVTNNTNEINSIIIKSDKYQTKEGFKVGSNINDIVNKGGIVNKSSKASKGNIPVINHGSIAVFDGIFFIDENSDDIIDKIMLHKN